MESVDGYTKFSEFKPDPKYLQKSYLLTTIGMLLIALFFVPMFVFFGIVGFGVLADYVTSIGPLAEFFVQHPVIVGIIILLFFESLAILWARLTYNALSYYLTKSEIVVKSGVIFKKDVTIPMRTITNIDLIFGPVDRMFGLATVNIQTAGSVSLLAEGRIVGMLREDGEELRDLLKTRLQSIQGGDGTGIHASSDTSVHEDPVELVLTELRAIKNVLIDIRDKNDPRE